MSSDAPPSDAPPTYEQSLHHPRLQTGFTTIPPQYTEYDDPFQARYPHSSYYHQQHHPSHHHHHHRGGANNRVSPYDTFAFVPATNLQAHGGHRGRGAQGQGPHQRGPTHSDPIVVLDDAISTSSSMDGGESCIKMTLIPMKKGMAVTCLICNIVVPGMGTILSGLCVFCCLRASSSHWSEGKKLAACALNIGLGLAQLALVPFMLLGWIWSILWGFAFLGLAVDDGSDKRDQDDCQSTDGEQPAAARCRRPLPPDHPHSNLSSTTDMQSAVSIQSASGGRQRAYRASSTLQVQPIVHAPPPAPPPAAVRERSRGAEQHMVVESATDFPVTETEAPSGSSDDSDYVPAGGDGGEDDSETDTGTRARPARMAQYAVSAISEEPIMVCESGSDWDCDEDDDNDGGGDPVEEHLSDLRQNGARSKALGTDTDNADGDQHQDVAPRESSSDKVAESRSRLASAGSQSSARVSTVAFGVATNSTMADISM